jgi:hypothetical protein
MHCPVTFFLFFICFWAVLSLFFARIGGWNELARFYRYQGQAVDKKRHLQSVGMRGWMSYRGCLTVGANPAGLYLSFLFLFRAGHPNLFIPWREIKVGRQRFFGLPVLVFKFSQAPDVTLTLHQSLEGFLKSASGRDLPLDLSLDTAKILTGGSWYLRIVIIAAVLGLITALYVSLLAPNVCRLR